MSFLLQTSNLFVGYSPQKKLLGPLNIDLRAGKITALLGRNGTGKSTLIRTLAGLQKPLGGDIFIEKVSIKKIKAAQLAKKVSILFTKRLYIEHCTVLELISLARTQYTNWLGKLSKEDENLIETSMQRVGITELAHIPINKLSDGQMQKVMLAKALARDTPIIILDEPTAHLDIPNRYETIELLQHMAQAVGKAILFSTHELHLALQKADEIWLVSENNTMVTAPAAEITTTGAFQKAFGNKIFF